MSDELSEFMKQWDDIVGRRSPNNVRLVERARIAQNLDRRRKIEPYDGQPYIDRDYGRKGPEEPV